MLDCILLLVLSSCSDQSGSSISPILAGVQDDSLTVINDYMEILAVYDAVIDPVEKTFQVTPVERNSQFHFPLTQLYPNILQITGYGWTPNFWADIKLKHPFPGSGIDAFDPRVIAILPANSGVSFSYPVFNCISNNRVLHNPDGYTKLFDDLGGTIPGNTNPFKAYFKGQSYRRWSSTVATEETQRWQMDINGFGGPLQFKLVVDVSTNYPALAQPVVDNAPEPVQIAASIGAGLTSYGGSAPLEVTFLDWQGPAEIKCKVESPDLFTGGMQLFYSRPGPNPNEYVFSGTIVNSLLAPTGNHSVLIAAWDIPQNIHIFYETTASVSDSIPVNGELLWAKPAGGTNVDLGYGVAALSNDSFVATGYFMGTTATFGKGDIYETVLTNSSSVFEEIFVARYNSNGAVEWAKKAGGEYSDISRGIATLSDNSIVITGYFQGSATFGPGEINQTVLTFDGYTDIFIARYNTDGSLAWAKRAGGIGSDFGNGITTLSDNSIVITGSYEESATFGEGEPNETVLTGYSTFFIAKYNPDGSLAWAKQTGGSSGGGIGYGIAKDSNNSPVVTGYFAGSLIFGPGEINQTVLTSVNAGQDVFVAKFNQNGILTWAKQAGGASDDRGYAITSLSDNSTIATGYYEYEATFGKGEPNQTLLTGSYDIFISKFNPDGTLAWAKQAGGESGYGEGYSVATRTDNTIVATGRFSGDALFGQGDPNQTVLIDEDGAYDIFVARYNANGTLVWAKSAMGENFNMGYGITTLSDNSSVVTGNFYGTVTFGQGESNETFLNCEAYSYDIFIARFAP
jgi:uncharacterized delta-60 repeat protein